MNFPTHHRKSIVTIAQASTEIHNGAKRLEMIDAFANTRLWQWDNTPEILIFPELFLSGYSYTLCHPKRAARADERQLPLIQDIAKTRGLWIITGLARNRPNGIANSAVALGPDGQVVAEYDKVQLFGTAERKAFIAGRQIVIFDSPIGRTALAICFDVEQAYLVNKIASAGATNLIVPTANMSPYSQVSEKTLPARAKEAGIRIIYANYAGVDGDLTMLGQSTVVDSRGKTVTLLGKSPELLNIMITSNHADWLGTTSQPVGDPFFNP